MKNSKIIIKDPYKSQKNKKIVNLRRIAGLR